MSSETQTHIGCLVVRSVCGKAGKGIQKEIEGWISRNGVEWTTGRLKALWNAALHLRNGDTGMAIKAYQESSIAYHKATCYPKGNMGYVVRHFVQARRPSVLRRYAAVLRFYTCLKLDRVSRKQKRKFEASIANPRQHWDERVYTCCTQRAAKLLARRMKGVGLTTSKVRKHLESYDYDPSRLSGSSYYFSDEKCPRDLRNQPYGSFVWSYMTSLRCPDLVGRRMYQSVDVNLLVRDFGAWVGDQHFGRICALQEQGCKARVVYQPNARVQMAMYPLHKVLAKATRIMYPESCVEDQVSGVYLALEHLEAGGTIHSVDLSSATDRFPRAFSNLILRELKLDEYAQAIDEICYESNPVVGSNESLKYSVGQPMGLYGSFPLFNLSNLLVCEVAQQGVSEQGGKLTTFRGGSTFSVLGDDVIFSDPVVALLYQKLMYGLGCDISLNKTFSGRVGEFAGFLIMPAKDGHYTAFRPYKVPPGDRITNPLEFLHGLGIKASGISKYWQEMYDAYSKTLGMRDLSLTPLVGEEHPTVDSQVSSQWMNALVNRVLAHDGVSMMDQEDLPDLNHVFHEHIRRSPQTFVADTYIALDRRSKDRKRNRFHTLRDDPLIREYRREFGLRDTSSLKRGAKQRTR